MTSLRFGPRIALDTGYKFKRAVDCDLTELESVLDCYAPINERKGNWIHNPIAPDPMAAYEACYETLRGIDPNTELTTTELTTTQYIRKALADKEEGSLVILEFTKTLAKYLLKNESKGD